MGGRKRATSRPGRRRPPAGARPAAGVDARPSARSRAAASPDPVRRLARADRLGHRLQRYTEIDPELYTTAGEALFPSRQLDRSRSEEEVEGVRRITQNLRWVERLADNPPLAVSESGRLAIESTAGQAKAFFALADDARANAQRLEEQRSRVTLAREGSRTVTVPRRPADPGPETRSLVQVRPAPNREVNPDGPLIDADECDSVSEAIVRGKNVVVGNPVEGFEATGTVSIAWGRINDLARAAGGFATDEPLSGFQEKRQQARKEQPNVRSSSLPISKEVRDYFAWGLFRRSHLVPVDQVLRALSVPGLPDDVRDQVLAQVYELHVGKTEDERPDTADLLSYVERVLRFQRVREYQLHRKDAGLDRRLGLDKEAAPGVGESFSTLAQWNVPVVDEHGAVSHEIDVSAMSYEETEEVFDDLVRMRDSVQRLGTLAADKYQRVRGVVPFQEHHGAVVARDGPDAVTFENYNREVEQTTLWSDLWDDLLEEFPDLADSLDEELRELREELRQAQEDPALDPYGKARRITRIRESQVELLRQRFVEVAAETELQVDSNLKDDAFGRWYFAMYGPGPQSFHTVWSRAVSNAVTVRTRGDAG